MPNDRQIDQNNAQNTDFSMNFEAFYPLDFHAVLLEVSGFLRAMGFTFRAFRAFSQNLNFRAFRASGWEPYTIRVGLFRASGQGPNHH